MAAILDNHKIPLLAFGAISTPTNSTPMDFCAWCVGPGQAAQLTAQGKTGGICAECKARQIAEVKALKEARRK